MACFTQDGNRGGLHRSLVDGFCWIWSSSCTQSVREIGEGHWWLSTERLPFYTSIWKEEISTAGASSGYGGSAHYLQGKHVWKRHWRLFSLVHITKLPNHCNTCKAGAGCQVLKLESYYTLICFPPLVLLGNINSTLLSGWDFFFQIFKKKKKSSLFCFIVAVISLIFFYKKSIKPLFELKKKKGEK